MSTCTLLCPNTHLHNQQRIQQTTRSVYCMCICRPVNGGWVKKQHALGRTAHCLTFPFGSYALSRNNGICRSAASGREEYALFAYMDGVTAYVYYTHRRAKVWFHYCALNEVYALAVAAATAATTMLTTILRMSCSLSLSLQLCAMLCYAAAATAAHGRSGGDAAHRVYQTSVCHFSMEWNCLRCGSLLSLHSSK